MKNNFDIAIDSETPASVFLKLRSLQPKFLLESIEGGTTQSRYSFLGLGQTSEVSIKKGIFYINGEADSKLSSLDDLMTAFRKALIDLPDLLPEIKNIPFGGGLVGFSSYDVVRYFEKLPIPKEKKGIFNPPDCSYLAPTSLLIFDHFEGSIALLHSGGESERLLLREEVLGLLKNSIEKRNASNLYFSDPKANVVEKTFHSSVEKAKQHIFEGDIFQIVLSIAFSGATNLDPFEVYRAMRLINPSPYMFFYDLNGFQVVGSSPEALVRLNNGKASLRPIAGTRPRSEDVQEDLRLEQSLLTDQKEIAEHVMLVDLARNDLGRVANKGSIEVNPYQSIERYSHVMHIVSGVQGTLDETKDAFDLFSAAFPAGTLVGAPKVRAMELIDDIEPNLRGVYGGTVGYFGKNGDMDQAIAIRTIVFSKGKYCFQAGAGIVADSIADSEYKEVLAKSEILRTALKMVAEGME